MKGIMFTVMTFLLVFSVIGLASAFASTNLDLKHDANLLSSGTKLAYAFESVRSQMQEPTGVDVTKEEENVTFNDTLPRQNEIQDFLSQYGDFVDDKLEDPTLTLQFVDTSGNVIDWGDLNDATIRPFNITYVYPNTGKNSLEVNALNTSELVNLKRMDLNVRVNGVLVSNATGWSPEHECNPPGVTPTCLPFRVTITDGITTYDSGEKNFELDKQSAIQHAVSGGWIRVTVGGSSGRVLQVEINGITVTTDTKFNFATADFAVFNDPARIRLFDRLTFLEADV